jgi:AraC-like DNA-binding protein
MKPSNSKSPCYTTRRCKDYDAKHIGKSLYALAVARGLHAQKVLHGTGIFLNDLEGDTRISVRQLLALSSNVQKQSNGHDISFLLGRYLVETLDPDVLISLKSARNIEQCLRLISIFNAQYFPFMSAHKFGDEKTVHLLLQEAHSLEKQKQFYTEAACSAMMALLTECFGRRLKCSFCFPFSKPRHIYEYEESLGYRLSFSHAYLSIEISKAEMRAPCEQANPRLMRYALAKALPQKRCSASIVDKIRSHLRSQPQATLPEVAQRFDVSAATLKRILHEQGFSFQHIRDELRRQEALYYLQVKKLKNEQSAQKMHFNDVTNFRRAVKRWTGLTPSQLRGA